MSKKSKKLQPIGNDNEWIEEEFSGEKAPVAKAAPSVQLSPIVQPIAIVPYSSLEQPLFQYESSYDLQQAREDIAQGFDRGAVAAAPQPTEKKVRFVPIFIAVLSLLIVAVMVLGKFVLQEYLVLSDGMSGYAYIMDLIDMVTGELIIADLIIPGAVALIAVFAVINLIASLIKMKSRGACVVSKICLFFMLTFSLVLVLINLMNETEIGYGLYAVAGLSFLSLIVGYLAKKDRK